MKFNEDSRVKIPTILHLTRLGYTYLPLKGQSWDTDTNIFTEIFTESLLKINQGLQSDDVERIYTDLSLVLNYHDLGKAFYTKLIDQSGVQLIDFDNFDNNTFHVVTELTYKKDDDEFRPDIILLVNGMPLAFIEVKKPNNKDGILAERDRINTRSQNKNFRHFFNLTQLMVFSNNMEYDDESPLPLEGAFYAAPSYSEPKLNYFREEPECGFSPPLLSLDDEIENLVLKDNNLVSIKSSKEFATNKSADTPTNRICSSLFSRERLAFLLRYAIAYVTEDSGLEKHIMRYPQVFATKAIEAKLDAGTRKGIIWHTQGSGKTALAYYNVRHLTDYFTTRSIVPKFYFIVDRLDLLTQARDEFQNRGLIVHTIESREAFATDIKSTEAIHNDSGNTEITVVNIQKFKDDPSLTQSSDYAINIQRIYFLDEVHRSYNPKGSFLANLELSDPNAIKIGLTGTPLLNAKLDKDTRYDSRALFGNYLHKYYYNASIADGYTLRLIREGIETSYQAQLQEILDQIKVKQGDIERKQIYAHTTFVSALLDYIVQNFEHSRLALGDSTIGGMVVCDSADQAKEMFRLFEERYGPQPQTLRQQTGSLKVAEDEVPYISGAKHASRVKTAALILHDIGTKQDRRDLVNDFKTGKIDFLFVYNMLLTGFDAKRLKKLYIGRLIKSHNLLQTLTRVNRTYGEHRYGYVVDFADISKEFDKTNKAYFDELQAELGDEFESYSDLFKSTEEIEKEIAALKELLWNFDTDNAEVFDQQISQISDRSQMLEITKALNHARSLYNMIRLTGDTKLAMKLDFDKLTHLSRIANAHLDIINQKEKLESGSDTANLLNVALEDVIFKFTKISEAEMKLADELKGKLRQTRETLGGNFDPGDPSFVTLKEELERLFKKKNLSEVTQQEMVENIDALKSIHERAVELNRHNNLIRAKYHNDEKYARLHKRLMEKGNLTDSQSKLFDALSDLKAEADEQVLQNSNMLHQNSFVEKMMTRLVMEQLKKAHQLPLDAAAIKLIGRSIVKEYLAEHDVA